jgi:hypothetical protein
VLCEKAEIRRAYAAPREKVVLGRIAIGSMVGSIRLMAVGDIEQAKTQEVDQ